MAYEIQENCDRLTFDTVHGSAAISPNQEAASTTVGDIAREEDSGSYCRVWQATVSQSLNEELTARAKAEKMSKSALVRKAVSYYLATT